MEIVCQGAVHLQIQIRLQRRLLFDLFTLDLNIIHQKKGKIYIFKVTADSFLVYGTRLD